MDLTNAEWRFCSRAKTDGGFYTASQEPTAEYFLMPRRQTNLTMTNPMTTPQCLHQETMRDLRLVEPSQE